MEATAVKLKLMNANLIHANMVEAAKTALLLMNALVYLATADRTARQTLMIVQVALA